MIVGAGFSGTMVAVQLLKKDHAAPLRVVLVNRSGPMARGVAYGTRSSRHVLNVPAGRMSAFPDDEDHFLRFVQERIPGVSGGSFVPRASYGDYLEWLLGETAARSILARLEQITGEAVDVEVRQQHAFVKLADGRVIQADRVVLAIGNYPPSDVPIPNRGFYESARYVRDPWAIGALEGVSPHEAVLLLGSGLTMLDVSLELGTRSPAAHLTILSRRGLLPLPHRGHGSPPSYDHLPPGLVACEHDAVEYLKAVRRHVREVAQSGIDWRDVVASLRPVTRRLWESLPPHERARFLRHLRPYWDVHRHRVAPELYSAFRELQARGAVTVRAGRVVDIVERGRKAEVTLRPRGAVSPETLTFGKVINCTGPETDLRHLNDPLIAALLSRGIASTDDAGLGLRVSSRLCLLDSSGAESAPLLLVGPLLRGAFWEATAVPELRQHAADAAALIHQELAGAAIPSR